MPEGDPTLDGWTILHVLTGVVLAVTGVPRARAYGIIIGTEIVEIIFRRMGISFFRESPPNVITDIGASSLGYEIARVFLRGR